MTGKNCFEGRRLDQRAIEASVSAILEDVRMNGDAAVKKYTKKFDGVAIHSYRLDAATISAGAANVADPLKNAMRQAADNIERFHAQQLKPAPVIETMPGVSCWRKGVPIERVGLYIPGGSAPLFSTVLMLGIPARIAGCRNIVLCSPPNKDGSLHPAILFAAQLAGITEIFAVGGVQAIAAMAYGTETVPATDKIFGPGNTYVTQAKQLIQKDGLAIDMPAGPSEVAIYADESAHVSFVAADLLSQAEHGADSQVILVCNSASFAQATIEETARQLATLPRKDIAADALQHSRIFVIADEAQALRLLNRYAPEHLILACENAEIVSEKVINAGSVFLGHYSPESVGDYASGTNHTLPTNGYAKAYSGVSVDSFLKQITFQRLTPAGLEGIAETVAIMARAEGLDAHARAVNIRKNQTK